MHSFMLFLLLSALSYQSEAKAKIPFGKREVLKLAADLPDVDSLRVDESDDKQFLDIGTLHEEFNIAWILPLWVTKEPRLVGYNKVKDLYYDIPEDKMDQLLAEHKLDKKKLLSIGFYSRYGGKLVALLLIALIIWGVFSKKKTVTPENV